MASSVFREVPKIGGPTSLPKLVAFNAVFRAKEPPAALFLKDATANQPERTVQVGK